jgi:hydrogenase nickel incorporation protein HypA/HybF
MHEEAMLKDLVREAEAVARREGAHRVRRVRLWVGARSHLAGPEFQDRWAHAVQGTSLAAAEVDIETSTDPADPRAERLVLQSLDIDTDSERA